MNRIAETVSGFRAFLRTRAGQRLLKGVSFAFTAGLIAYLLHQLSGIGWRQLLASVPRTPWFYLAFAPFYLATPLFETAIFRLLWNCPARRILPVLFKKRVYSRYLLDYSGEAYLFLWARRNIDLPERKLLHALKDNIIISSSTSLLVGLVVLVALLYSGQIGLPEPLFAHGVTHVGTAALIGGSVALLGIKFRRRILAVARGTAAILFGLHAGRLLALMLAQLLMWTAAGPAVPLKSWLSLLAVEVVVSRIPFLPNRDFVFLGTGLKVAGTLDLALPLLAGTLLTANLLEKLLNLCLFTFFTCIRPTGQAREEIDPSILEE